MAKDTTRKDYKDRKNRREMMKLHRELQESFIGDSQDEIL